MPNPREADLLRKLEDVTRLVSDWVWETDRDQRLTYASPRIFDLCGLLPEQVAGLRLTDLGEFRDPNGGLVAVDWNRPFRDLPFELVHRRDGTLRHMRVSGLPVHCCDTGRLLGVRGIARDVTEARRAEERLRRAKEDAETANRAKSHFLAMVSHELRTPLHIVIGFSELIQSQAAGPIGRAEYLDYAMEIQNSGKHLNELVGALLDLANLDTGGHTPEPLDLTRTIVKAAEEFAARCRDRGLEFRLALPEAPVSVRADGRAVRQMLTCLLSNAIKFTPRGGTVTISSETLPDGGAFMVRDTGIGMPADQIDRLFRPFEQAEGGYQRTETGLGVGLALVKGLVSIHGGRIDVASTPGAGTAIRILLPNAAVPVSLATTSRDPVADFETIP